MARLSLASSAPKICSLNNLGRVITNNSKVAVLCTQNGCPVCPPFRKTVKEALKGRVRVVEVNASKNVDCFNTAVKLKVTDTPTLFYFKDGKLRKRIYSTGDPDMDKKNLEKLK